MYDIKRYFIGIGEKSNYYTLRAEIVKYSGEGYPYLTERHVQNLSIDRGEAERKAYEITGQQLIAPNEDMNEIGARTPVDWSVMQFGKHHGTPIEEVDKDYLIFILDKGYLPASAEPQREALTALVAAELADLQRTREKEAAEAASAANKLIDALGREWLEHYARVGTGFMGDVAKQVLEGHHALSDRQEEILFDIRAKAEGRRNSKAYNAKLDELEALF